jgi:hypothetical protein
VGHALDAWRGGEIHIGDGERQQVGAPKRSATCTRCRGDRWVEKSNIGTSLKSPLPEGG